MFYKAKRLYKTDVRNKGIVNYSTKKIDYMAKIYSFASIL